MKEWASFVGGPHDGQRLYVNTDQETVLTREESEPLKWQPGPVAPTAPALRTGVYQRMVKSSYGGYGNYVQRAHYEWQGWQ